MALHTQPALKRLGISSRGRSDLEHLNRPMNKTALCSRVEERKKERKSRTKEIEGKSRDKERWYKQMVGV